MNLEKHKTKKRVQRPSKPADPALFVQTQAIQIEHQKTQFVKKIFRKLGIKWNEINWQEVRALKAKEGFKESLYFKPGTDDEIHLCDFDIKVQEDGFYLDVQSGHL